MGSRKNKLKGIILLRWTLSRFTHVFTIKISFCPRHIKSFSLVRRLIRSFSWGTNIIAKFIMISSYFIAHWNYWVVLECYFHLIRIKEYFWFFIFFKKVGMTKSPLKLSFQSFVWRGFYHFILFFFISIKLGYRNSSFLVLRWRFIVGRLFFFFVYLFFSP